MNAPAELLAIPYRLFPTPQHGIGGYVTESLIELHCDDPDSPLPLVILGWFAPALSREQLVEAVRTICTLSGAVSQLQDDSSGRWPEWDVLVDEYRAAVESLASQAVAR